MNTLIKAARFLFVYALLFSSCLPTVASAQSTGTFAPTGSMVTARYGHAATLLADGRVLIAGGMDAHNNILASTEIYDPATGTFSATGSMTTPRYLPSATLLPDGRVLITGRTIGGIGFASAEVYDPATGMFTVAGTPVPGHSLYRATLLNNGMVLVLVDSGTVDFTINGPTQVVLYDPMMDSFTATGNGPLAGTAQTTTLLTDGRVLIASGTDTNGIVGGGQIYDPSSQSFAPVGDAVKMVDYVGYWNTATLLSNGKVLFVGGGNGDVGGPIYPITTLFDPATATFSPTPATRSRYGHKATLLAAGTVLITGGFDPNYGLQEYAGAELYDPSSATFNPAGPMVGVRSLHTATLLRDGTVLIAGGAGYEVTATAELYRPAN